MAWRQDWQKPALAAVAILFHILLIAALLRLEPLQLPRQAVQEIETMLVLSPAPAKPVTTPQAKHPEIAAPSQPSVPLFVVPKAWQRAPQQSANSLHGLLFNCAPENLANLTPQELAGCRAAAGHAALDPNAVDYRDHTNRSKYAALWAMRKARQNAPPLLPCASSESVFATLSTATLLCLAKFAAGGFKLDDVPGYGDKHETLPPPIIEDHGHLHNSATD